MDKLFSGFSIDSNRGDETYDEGLRQISRLSPSYTALALRRTPACGALSSGSTGRQLYIAPCEAFLFRNGFLENRDSKRKIEENDFHLSCNFLSNGYNFIILAWKNKKHCAISSIFCSEPRFSKNHQFSDNSPWAQCKIAFQVVKRSSARSGARRSATTQYENWNNYEVK